MEIRQEGGSKSHQTTLDRGSRSKQVNICVTLALLSPFPPCDLSPARAWPASSCRRQEGLFRYSSSELQISSSNPLVNTPSLSPIFRKSFSINHLRCHFFRQPTFETRLTRGAEGKTLIIVAAQEDGRGIGRIRLLRIPDFAGESLAGAVKMMVEPSSTVHTDGLRSYSGLSEVGYRHTVTRQKEAVGNDSLPRVHRVASLLKRWLLGTYQGAVEPAHLDYYLDEFTFRFNRRISVPRQAVPPSG